MGATRWAGVTALVVSLVAGCASPPPAPAADPPATARSRPTSPEPPHVAEVPLTPGRSVEGRPTEGGGDPKAVGYLASPVARWNPCRPITYRVNLADAPAGIDADVREAVGRVAAATGLRFADAGSTDVVPGARGRDRLEDYPKGTDLVIAFVRPGRSAYVEDTERVLGTGGAFYETTPVRAHGRPWHRIVQGYVVLDGTKDLPGGFGAGRPDGLAGTWGQVLMHELGHAVGLEHPTRADPRQIMYAQTSRKPAQWGAGDLAGLRTVGRQSGCLPAK